LHERDARAPRHPVSGGWLDIQGPGGPRREALLEGLTRLGAANADVLLPGAGEDQLHVWNRPPRVVFLGRGARPTAGGAPFEERALKPGERFEWAGHSFQYGGEAASADMAVLEELPGVAAAAPSPLPATPLLARVRAGLACELGLVDAAAAKRWREAVQAGQFEPDACARELLPRPLADEAERRMLERSGSLLRDFLMAPLLTGAAGARRKLREKTRGVAAFLLTQGLALVVFALLVAAALLLARFKGTSIDALLDGFLPG
jgi:hypothetical protein